MLRTQYQVRKQVNDKHIDRIIRAIHSGKYDIDDTPYFLNEVQLVLESGEVSKEKLRKLFLEWAIVWEQIIKSRKPL